MPWCRIKEVYELGQIRILPFQRHKPIEGVNELDNCRINALLAAYKTVMGRPVHEAALIHYVPKPMLAELEIKEIEEILELINIACFCALSDRECFSQLGAYCNSSCFTLYFQKLGKPGGVAPVTRRIDGRTYNGCPIDELQVTIPIHCRRSR